MSDVQHTEHTPGPWRFIAAEGSDEDRVVMVERMVPWETIIARLGQENEFDGHLIAAAPELLAASEALAAIVVGLFEGLEIVAAVPQELRTAVAQAQKAIAKAKRGEA